MPRREVDEMPRCASCGILIPVQEIVKTHEGRQVIVCSEKCFRIYTTYWYPRYGKSHAVDHPRPDKPSPVGERAG